MDKDYWDYEYEYEEEDDEEEEGKVLRARGSDPVTSHIAAVDSEKSVGTKMKMVLDVISSFGPNGCISEDVERITGIRNQSLTPLFKPMLKRRLIVRPGTIRMTEDTKRYQLVMIAFEKYDFRFTVSGLKRNDEGFEVKRCPTCGHISRKKVKNEQRNHEVGRV
jgi:hypothetical protein